MKNPVSEILAAASKLFKQYGYKKTSVDEIALGAGIAKSTLYQHYRSKEEILLAVVVHEAQMARKKTWDRLGSIPDPLIRLRRMGELGLDYFRGNPFVVGLLSGPPAMLSHSRHSHIITLAESEMIDILRQIIEEGQQAGKIRKSDAKTIAYLFLKVFQSFTYARTGSLPFDEVRHEKEKQEVLDILIGGITEANGQSETA